MNFSVVIPAYNGKDLLHHNLQSVIKLNPKEIIIVDDCSSDGTGVYLSNNYPQVKLFTNSYNMGFTKTANIGFSHATEKYVLLLNQDVNMVSVKMQSLLLFFKKHSDLLAVNLNEQKNSWPSAKIENGMITFSNGPHSDKPVICFWPSGGSALYNRFLWESLGGFDPLYSPGYFEDLDLGYRAYKHGLQVLWDPDSQIDHNSESTFKKSFKSRKLQLIKDRNYLLVHWKNLDFSNIPIHFLSLLDRLLTSPGFIIPTMLAVLHLPSVIKFRKSQKGTISDANIFKKLTAI